VINTVAELKQNMLRSTVIEDDVSTVINTVAELKRLRSVPVHTRRDRFHGDKHRGRIEASLV